jgi:hypothetical protein
MNGLLVNPVVAVEMGFHELAHLWNALAVNYTT